MRLRQIEVFHAVYSTGSMTSAAVILNVSQPSVSKVLAHAEQQLGYLLFDRVRGKLVATPEAHRLFAHVSAVYRDVDRLRHVAENLRKGNSGRIRIACTPAFGLEVLPAAVQSFRQEHKDTVFEIETLHVDQMADALLESRLDVGIAFDAGKIPGIVDETLASSRFVVLAPPEVSFGGKQVLQATDLCGHPFIGLNGRGPLGRALSLYLEPVEASLDVVIWSETYHVVKSLVARGAGITVVDEVTARSGDTSGMQILPLEPPLPFDIKALSLAAAPLSIATQNFVQHFGIAIRQFLAD
jgi:DNA-binding transcriptional LysR family regulator